MGYKKQRVEIEKEIGRIQEEAEGVLPNDSYIYLLNNEQLTPNHSFGRTL